MPEPLRSFDAALERARVLLAAPGPAILGITGPPGAGKSVLTQTLATALGEAARVVPMDGFHLAQAVLDEAGLAEVKGAPETFDAWGFVALLGRIRDAREPVVHAPRFDRGLEEPVAGAIRVPARTPLVITEGNYLLLSESPWSEVQDLCDEVWFVDPGEERRLAWLIRRHEAYGSDPATARARALGSDQANAGRIRRLAQRADVIITLPTDPATPVRT